jgi:hypothetical protein
MAQRKRVSKGKSINPTYYVFCEGETEEAYVKWLKSKYRVSIEIDAKISGNDICERYISSYKRKKPTHVKDKTFLLYDADAQHTLERLKQIKSAQLLLSNPCIELWFLLHLQEHSAHISSEDCVKKIKKHHPEYEKGKISKTLKDSLEAGEDKSCNRAKKLKSPANPSTQIPDLILQIKESSSLKNS